MRCSELRKHSESLVFCLVRPCPTRMYFWRIEQLKAKMALAPLSDREVLPYLAVFAGLSAAVSSLPYPTYNIWNALSGVCSVLIAIVGTLYIYRQNGGATGEHLLQRYFALGWVVTVRWLGPIVLALIAYLTALEAAGVSSDSTTWYDALFFVVGELVIYIRTAYHVRDLAQRTKA
jgi:hypothetical protein